MPALPTIPNVIRCSVQGLLPNGRQWVNVIHVLKPTATSYAVAITTIDPLIVNLYTVNHTGGGVSMFSQMVNTLKMASIAYLPLDGTSASTILAHSISAVSTSQVLPHQTALVVTAQTGLRGPQHRGRTFLPPMTEDQNDVNGVPLATMLPGLQHNWDGFLADMTAATMFPVVASYKHVSQAIITNYIVRSKWATRRKRQGRQL